MVRYTKQERVIMVKHYYQNGVSLVDTIREVRQIFGRTNVPNSLIVKRIIGKFESTLSVVDVKHKMSTLEIIPHVHSLSYKQQLV